ncbi:AcrB/AcrD/AcrF family protein, partial [mine drainage metagenome]
MQDNPNVASVGSRLGSWHGSGNTGTLLINLKPLGDGRSQTTEGVMNQLRLATARVPGISVFLRPVQDIGGPGGGNSKTLYSYNLKGDNYAELEAWTPKLAAAMRKSKIFTDVGTSLDSAGLRETLDINRNAAARLGIGIGAIDGALYDAFGQRQISTIYTDMNQYQVVLNAMPSMAATPESIKHLYVQSRSGGMVPITAVATLKPGLAPTEVDHEGQFPVVSVSFNLAPNVAMSAGYAAINQLMKDLRLPGDIHGGFGGDFRRFTEQQNSTPLLLLGALLAVYIVLGMLYENLIHPITILSTLPAAGFGAMLALLVTNTELSVVSIIAIVLLIGIVKKNAIMMVDFALAAERERGLAPIDAIREACLVRFRPIMMTTMVAMLSALPLAIGFGSGAELRRPLGIALVGGLLFSQALTLLSTPADLSAVRPRQPAPRTPRRASCRACEQAGAGILSAARAMPRRGAQSLSTWGMQRSPVPAPIDTIAGHGMRDGFPRASAHAPIPPGSAACALRVNAGPRRTVTLSCAHAAIRSQGAADRSGDRGDFRDRQAQQFLGRAAGFLAADLAAGLHLAVCGNRRPRARGGALEWRVLVGAALAAAVSAAAGTTARGLELLVGAARRRGAGGGVVRADAVAAGETGRAALSARGRGARRAWSAGSTETAVDARRAHACV